MTIGQSKVLINVLYDKSLHQRYRARNVMHEHYCRSLDSAGFYLSNTHPFRNSFSSHGQPLLFPHWHNLRWSQVSELFRRITIKRRAWAFPVGKMRRSKSLSYMYLYSWSSSFKVTFSCLYIVMREQKGSLVTLSSYGYMFPTTLYNLDTTYFLRVLW
jgi:hypothetical protein